jgi:HPt (histidine-containing phosphotransfer) domain-containing protein
MDTPPTVDRAALDRLVEWGGDKLLRQMLRLFLENSAERLTQMEAALGPGGDLDVLHRGAHSLKSSAANVGAMQMSAVAGRLEAIAEEGDQAASRALFEELTERFDAAEVELRRVLEGQPS